MYVSMRLCPCMITSTRVCVCVWVLLGVRKLTYRLITEIS